ncbi:MAG TPA: YndJ family transporter [Enhygromyxa sp.]|nr:YndJ family transporter [Enhygromyxa sp.]
MAGTAVWILWQLFGDPLVPAVLLSLSPLVLVPLLLGAVLVEREPSSVVRLLIWAQLPCALPLVLGLSLRPGVLALLACLPWAGWTALAAFEALRRVRALIQARGVVGLLDGELAVAAALGFPLIGSAWLSCDRLAIQPLGFSPLIVTLTAVHFHHAGFTLPISAGLLARTSQPGPWRLVAISVVVAVPLVAIGITASPIVELIGSWLTAAAAVAVGLGLLARARSLSMIPALLSAGAGACLLAAMIFAGSYALGEYRGVAWPDIASMIQLHGAVNALGFGLLGAWAWHLSPPTRTEPVDAVELQHD